MNLRMPSGKWRPFCLGLRVNFQLNNPVELANVPQMYHTDDISKSFYWMDIIVFQFKLHWNIFPGGQSSICQYWFREWLGDVSDTPLSEQRWPSSLIYVTRPQWVNTCPYLSWYTALRWRHNKHHCVSNHQPHDCLLNRLFRCRSKEISKLRVTGLCAGKSPVTGEFPTQRASNAENVSIWWRHHGISLARYTEQPGWHHDMEAFSALLALCEWNPPVDSSRKWAVMHSLDNSFDVSRTSGWTSCRCISSHSRVLRNTWFAPCYVILCWQLVLHVVYFTAPVPIKQTRKYKHID